MADLLVTLPHHACEVPLEVLVEMLGPRVDDASARAELRERLRREGDPSTDRIFRLPGARFVSATVSRFVVDLNRAPSDRGPNGVVKRTDFAGRSLYPVGDEPNDDVVAARIRRFHDPFHRAVDEQIALRTPDLIIDGHSMTGDGPTLGPDAGRARPAASLITGGGPDGEPTDRPVSLAPEAARTLARALDAALMRRLPLGRDGLPSGVRINDPFAVGYIQDRLGGRDDGPKVPTVGIEIHRGLFEDAEARPIVERLHTIRGAIVEAIEALLASGVGLGR